MIQNSYDGTPTLYLVPTPIGNMDDITFRTVKVLKVVSVIFSEDTRITLNLLNYLDIHKKLIALHKFNETKVKENVLEYLENGESIALVTDRGTPIISDPGYETVKLVAEKGFNVVSLPGATALIPAVTVSGIPSNHFLFYGFLDSKISHKKKELEILKKNRDTIIFYEAPHRIKETLNIILDIFGDRYICICREISKKFETVYRGNISCLINEVIDKGEFVIVVSGYTGNMYDENISIIQAVDEYISLGLPKMDAIKKIAKERNVPKNEIYKEYLEKGDE